MTDISTINSLGGYPLGADQDSRAPWKVKRSELKDVEVTVSVTYSKTFKVKVEEGYDDADLKEAVMELGILPKQIMEERADAIQEDINTNDWLFTGYNLDCLKEERDSLRGWHEDEFEVISNE